MENALKTLEDRNRSEATHHFPHHLSNGKLTTKTTIKTPFVNAKEKPSLQLATSYKVYKLKILRGSDLLLLSL